MIKRLIVIITVLTLCFAFQVNTDASSYATEVKVGLYYAQSAKSSVTFSSSGGITVTDTATGVWYYSTAYNEKMTLQASGNDMYYDDKFCVQCVNSITLTPQGGEAITVDGKAYRGYIILRLEGSGKMSVINVVDTEAYVESVLGNEMGRSFPIEALKAQAVCARNYVLSHKDQHSAYGFDVCTGTHCQVYSGVSGESSTLHEATYATKGILAYYNGSVVPLFFYSSDGGSTEDSKYVWGSSYGYLMGKEDVHEKENGKNNHSWVVELTKEEITKKLQNSGINIGPLVSISVDKVSPTGGVYEMTFVGTQSSYTAKNEKCRTVLGLNSQKYMVLPKGLHFDILQTLSGEISAPFYVTDGKSTIKGQNLCAIDGEGKLSMLSSDAAIDTNVMVFSGGGYGHRVGMSQWGAYDMANEGYSYKQILEFYFNDIELR